MVFGVHLTFYGNHMDIIFIDCIFYDLSFDEQNKYQMKRKDITRDIIPVD